MAKIVSVLVGGGVALAGAAGAALTANNQGGNFFGFLSQPSDPSSYGPCLASLVAALGAFASYRGLTAKVADKGDVERIESLAGSAKIAAEESIRATRAEGATVREAVREEIGAGNAEIVAAIQKLQEAQSSNEGVTSTTQPARFVEAYLGMLNDERGFFAPARQEALAALEAVREGRAGDAQVEFSRVLSAFDNSLQQRGEMRQQMAREDAADYRRLATLASDREPQLALRAWRDAVKLDENDFWPWIELSRLEFSHDGNIPAARSAIACACRLAATERDRSVCLNELGIIEVASGNLAAARVHFEEDLEIARVLSSASPENAAAKRDVSVSLSKLGDVEVASGNLAAARVHFEEDLEIARVLSSASPENAAAKRDVSVSLSKLGDVEVASGNLAAARVHFEEDLEIARVLSSASPENAEAKRDVIVSLIKMGQITKEPAYWEEALVIAREMETNGQFSPTDASIPDYLQQLIDAVRK